MPTDTTRAASRLREALREALDDVPVPAARTYVSGGGSSDAMADAILAHPKFEAALRADQPQEEPGAGLVAAIMAAGASFEVAMRAAELVEATHEPRLDHTHDWQCVICGDQHPSQALRADQPHPEPWVHPASENAPPCPTCGHSSGGIVVGGVERPHVHCGHPDCMVTNPERGDEPYNTSGGHDDWSTTVFSNGNAKTVFTFADGSTGPGDWDSKTGQIVPAANPEREDAPELPDEFFEEWSAAERTKS